MDMETTFLYTVHPRKIITGISSVNAIRVPKSLYLTKEDVRTCLKNASVYRRFANEGRNERVTVANVDRLHNAKFMTEEEYEKFLASEVSAAHGSVTVPVQDVVEAPAEEKQEVKEESVVETAPVVEEVTEDDAKEEVVVESDDEAVENDGFFDKKKK